MFDFRIPARIPDIRISRGNDNRGLLDSKRGRRLPGNAFFEISRNQYQEYVVTADRSFESVAYYDAEHHELFCVIETAHQYNTLMKFRIEGGALTVYSLYSEKWNEYPGVYKK